MKNKASKQKSKRKGNVGAFGCDLTEHLQNSGQDVPQVLKTCAEFIEKHGIVDGIYRLSGITSNIQRLRQEYSSELCPELTREVYLQDIHCVGSLCKLYFRELPNPLLTYELYKKFMDAVSIKEEHEQLQYIQDVIKELPPPHYRTLEYLTKHLVHMASFRSQTNMHARNLALVWAPNLLRSKEIELPTCNGDMAFLEVRVQQTVVEFILNHVEQIFNYRAGSSSPKEGLSLVCEAKSATLPASSHCAPMKLMSLEEAQSRSLDQKHPIHRNRQRENSLPDTSTAALYQTVIDLPDSKMFSGKSKKWKSIFNLGRSVTDSKGKLSRNGSVFVKAQKISEKAPIRPTKSMDSLCSLSMEDIESEFRQSSGENDFFMPAFKSCTLISGNTSSQSEKEPEMLLGAMGGSPSTSRAARKSGTTPLQKALPEQMKVFKSDNNNCQPTSPKNRRMLYTSTNNDSSKLAFPGSLFPLESTPRHHHKALNISEPFAVSVPLRVSAVISSNSTPCRAPDKQEAALLPLKPSREAPLAHQGCSGSSKSACSDDRSCNEIPLGKEDWQSKAKSSRACTAFKPAEGQKEYHGMVSFNTREEVEQLSEPLHSPYQHSMKPVSSTISRDAEARLDILTPGQVSSPHAAESAKPQKQLENRLKQHYELGELTQLDKTLVKQEELWPIDHLDLKIIEPDVIDDTFELNCPSTNYTTNSVQLKAETHGKRRSSFPTYPVLNTDNSTLTAKKPLADHHTRNAHHLSLRDIPERGLSLNVSQKSDVKQGSENKDLAEPTVAAGTKSLLPLDQCTSTQKESFHVIQSQPIPPKLRESTLDLSQQSQVRTKGHSDSMTGDSIVKNELCDSVPEGLKALGKCDKQDTKGAIFSGEKDQHVDFRRSIVRFPKPMLERPKSLELPDKDDENAWGNNSEDLEQVEPWEDFSTTKQWVTSPLHSPKTFDFLLKAEELSSCSVVESSKGKEVVGDSHPNMRSVLSLGKDIQPCHDVKGNNTDNLQTQENKSTEIFEETTKSLRSLNSAPKGKVNPSSLQPHKQKSQNTFDFEKIKEHTPLKHQRPYSLNLDLGIAYVIETSGQHQFPDVSSTKRGAMASPETKHSCSSVQLEMFLADRQAAMRRNSAPVSVSSIRTAFVTKTCQAKSVPVIPPKIQFSLVPQPLQVKNSEPSLEKERENMFVSRINEVLDPLPALTSVKYPKEEMENNKPVSKTPRHVRACSSLEMCKATLPTDQPVLRRKRNSNGEASVNDSRFEKSTIVQRQSFRTRPNRPQSLILFSPPFPIMDYPPLGDDAKLPLSHIKNDTETSTSPLAFNEEVDENVTNPDGVTSQNKMAMPKSGQRLETSMSCFYQPQRRSMIFDSRSNRQID